MLSYTPYKSKVPTSSNSASQGLRDPEIWSDIGKFWANLTVPILKGVARVIVQTASKYSPPGKNGKHLGNASIDNKLYYCKIIDLVASLKDPDVKKRPRKQDYPYIREGYKYKIIKNKYREPKQTLGYAKTLRTARQMARIKNRGLTKYSWGTLLNNFSGAVVQLAKRQGGDLYETELPPNFRFLANKSPNITRYRWGAIKIYSDDIKNFNWRMQGHNYCTEADAFNNIAVEKGVKAGVRRWNATLKAMSQQNITKLTEFLRFEIRKVTVKK